ncbi:hypothetical protein CRUP_001179 [Coryphaenoides rupestris]|nr:hypothetical protein CRUP_001179 [Coryphaenoides rupestris]
MMMMADDHDTLGYLQGCEEYLDEDLLQSASPRREPCLRDDSRVSHCCHELAAIKARVLELEMEEEAERMREEEILHCEQQQSAEMQLLSGSPQPVHQELLFPQVDYGATADELEIHFNGCGPVNRVTILCDRFSGHPKGFAYIEFSDRDSVQSAIGLDETLFRGRVLKVMPKRTNMPGISTTDRGGPRNGGRSRGRGSRPPRYHNGFQGRFRYQSARPPHPVPHPYYGGNPAGKRQWGPPEYREQTSKRYPCLLLITPPSEEGGPGPSGHHYPQQR